MSLQACADIVAKGDPERFAAAMAGPVAARRVLFPIYAFNVEVARAPWVASEPMIGEMRLQWWRDALDEIGAGGAVRAHEVTTPLGGVLDPEAANALDGIVSARRWDLYRDPFEDAAHFNSYISSGGVLMSVAARLLDPATDISVPAALGRAAALARFLAAVPALEARGRIPLLDGRKEAVQDLAMTALAETPTLGAAMGRVPKAARPALLEAWRSRAILTRIAAAPERVAEGRVDDSPFRNRASLLWASLRYL